MKTKVGTVCMILGTVMVLAALFLFSWNQWENKKAGISVESILPLLIGQIDTNGDNTPDPYDSSMTEVEIDGYAYIGYLSIPEIDLELPVMSEWDYTRLKIAPCRYSGSIKTDNMVIAAHNYRRHFGSLSKLSEDDRIYFIDMDGIMYAYEIVAMEILAPTDVEDMTAGNYDLTLFTCTYGGQSRVTVRCERVPEE